MVKKMILLIVSGTLFAMSACVKQQSYSIIPALTAINVSNTSIVLPANSSAYDTVLITLTFTDGDGDIGPVQGIIDSLSPFIPCTAHYYDSVIIADPNYNVFWYTYHAPSISRDSCIDEVQTAYVPVNPKQASITGLIQVYPSVGCPPTGTLDTITYSVFIKDRAGHVSNRLRTPPIYVSCN